MEEQLISFETAKLAKEKGFSVNVYDFYIEDLRSKDKNPYLSRGIEYDSDRDCLWNWNLHGGESGEGLKFIPYPNNDQWYTYTSAPVQALLQKWLREKYNIDVLVFHKNRIKGTTWTSEVYFGGHLRYVNHDYKNDYTYEDALEIGLFEALKLIDNGK